MIQATKSYAMDDASVLCGDFVAGELFDRFFSPKRRNNQVSMVFTQINW